MADALAASFRRLPAERRWNLRCRPAAVPAISGALGLSLPETMCLSGESGGRAALHLGPDEWLLRAPQDDGAWVEAIAPALNGQPFSLVDISHRQVAVMLAGGSAEAILATGCPLDLRIEAFPVGMCTRTVFAKAEILLWRRERGFLVEYWRSFSDYVEGLLVQAEQDSAW
jgi:sarcosine oxidase subunit gamma